MSDDMDIIARVPRNATTELLIKTGEFWKVEVVDVRWYSDGKPTRKGVRINMEELPTLIKALQKISNKNEANKDDTE